ncbi:MAG: murein biosynthesis integral membrane protein MurJ [Propionibacteriaceae bacterium]|jgi:putative peptidoglycan lipid II flippase|nr:murein biosynthesis integral membrane protein MurJ [Propionibacteriaceae bacterium]
MPEPSAEAPPPLAGATRRSGLLSATAVMAAGTGVSRVFGVVRVLLASAVFSQAGRRSDMFALATSIPNALYLLFAGGAVNQVLVPQIVRAIKNDPDGGEAYTNRVMTAFLLAIGALTVVVVAAAPLVTWVYVGDDWRTPENAAHYTSIFALTTLCLPQIFFYGAFFLGGQVLNARGVFGPMMWAPVANNVVQIGVLGLYAFLWGFKQSVGDPFTPSQVLLLGLGSGAALIVQTAVLIPFMRRIGFHYRPRFDLRGAGLGHTFAIAKWTLLFVAAAQLWYVILSRLASNGTAGNNGAGKMVYDNAYLIYVMPHSFVTISLGTALMSSLSVYAAQGQMADFAAELTHGIRLMSTVIIPAAVLFLAVGLPLTGLPPMWRDDGALTGWTLMALSLGLFPFSLAYLLQRAYFALEDNKSVFFQQLVITAVAIAGGTAAISFGHVGSAWVAPVLALANSVSYAVGLVWILIHSRHRIPSFRTGPILGHAVRVFAAIVPGACLAWLITSWQTRHLDGFAWDTAGLVAAIGVAGGVYLGLSKLLRLTEVSAAIGIVVRRLKPAKE